MDLIATARTVLDKAREILRGEPARAIGYGAAAVIYLVALALDRVPDMSPEDALAAATAAIVSVTGVIETIRRFVYSAPTVERVAEASASTGVPQVPPPPASDFGSEPADTGPVEDGFEEDAPEDFNPGNG